MFKKIAKILGCYVVLFWPVCIFGQEGGTPGPAAGGGTPPPAGGGTGPSVGARLENPLGDIDLIEFLQELLDVILVFAIPLIVFMIIYAGFMYVMGRGNPGEISKANKALLYAVIGGVVILGANIILAVVQGTVDAFRT